MGWQPLGYLTTLFQLLRLCTIEWDWKNITVGEKVWSLNEEVIAYVEVLSRSSPGETWKTAKIWVSLPSNRIGVRKIVTVLSKGKVR
jgi:hypothetical protein